MCDKTEVLALAGFRNFSMKTKIAFGEIVYISLVCKCDELYGNNFWYSQLFFYFFFGPWIWYFYNPKNG